MLYLKTTHRSFPDSRIELAGDLSLLDVNDDTFFLREVAPTYYLQGDGRLRARFGRGQLPADERQDTIHGVSGLTCRHLLNATFGYRSMRFEAPHEAVLFDQAILTEMESLWARQIESTRRSPLRSHADFGVHRFYPHFLLERQMRTSPGAATPVISDAGFLALGVGWERFGFMLRKVSSLRPSVVCLNDERGEHDGGGKTEIDRSVAAAEAWLSEIFPEPAPWELQPC